MKPIAWFGLTGIVAALAIMMMPVASVAAKGGVATGEQAPAFTLTDSNGVEHSLEDFAGKTVVLEWTNQQCPFVKKFYGQGHMQAWQEAYTTQDDVIWLTICSSAPGKQGHLTAEGWNTEVAEKGINSTAVLLDEDGTVGKAYAAKTTPHIYVIDGEGVLRYQGAIDSVRSTRTSDIDGATNYLADAVDALLAGSEVAEHTTQPYGCGVKY
ncbi:thioredoxin family protein [Algisphaera agarilytica]|uniref:Peroxiredoxin n=1 Tax=Algisphaera agarilytica TaxID=1385975 RepID=A0A7X0H9X1_9BACT|nr:thioredoxin family protein [Algisphaera agarilytica]MBB6430866.1 peroxiredoxin [Algisphaera agarilytica]